MQARLRGCSTFSITFLPFLLVAASGQHHETRREKEGEPDTWRVGGTNGRVCFVGESNFNSLNASKILVDRAILAAKENRR